MCRSSHSRRFRGASDASGLPPIAETCRGKVGCCSVPCPEKRLKLPFPEIHNKQVHLSDAMGTEVYDRDGSELVDNGLFIDHSPWDFNVFDLRAK